MQINSVVFKTKIKRKCIRLIVNINHANIAYFALFYDPFNFLVKSDKSAFHNLNQVLEMINSHLMGMIEMLNIFLQRK